MLFEGGDDKCWIKHIGSAFHWRKEKQRQTKGGRDREGGCMKEPRRKESGLVFDFHLKPDKEF